MSPFSEYLLNRFYEDDAHPYRVFESEVESHLTSETVLLDAGCGRSVPVLRKFLGRAKRLIGIEMVDFVGVPDGIETYHADLSRIPLPPESVDLVMSRSVFEHLTDPDAVYRELFRVVSKGEESCFLRRTCGTTGLWLLVPFPIAFMGASSDVCRSPTATPMRSRSR